jgi:hypothetical protein
MLATHTSAVLATSPQGKEGTAQSVLRFLSNDLGNSRQNTVDSEQNEKAHSPVKEYEFVVGLRKSTIFRHV